MIEMQLNARYDTFELKQDLKLPMQGVSVLFGESGCGKTTTLRALAGLSRLNNSQVMVNGEVWQSKCGKAFLPTYQRNIGYVFQQSALFAHLNVRQNICFALQGRKMTPKQAQTFEQLVSLLGLSDLLKRSLSGLSGGEKQRVAIARSLLMTPKLLLMDEPLAALDSSRKSEVLPYLETLTRESQVPIIYVTHSVSEVIKLADHVVVMAQGKVKQQGEVSACLPMMLDTHDATAQRSLLKMLVAQHSQDGLTLLTNGHTALWVASLPLAIGREVRCEVLASDVSVTTSRAVDSSIMNILAAKVLSIVPDVAIGEALLSLELESGQSLLALITQHSVRMLELKVGSYVWAQVKAVAIL